MRHEFNIKNEFEAFTLYLSCILLSVAIHDVLFSVFEFISFKHLKSILKRCLRCFIYNREFILKKSRSPIEDN